MLFELFSSFFLIQSALSLTHLRNCKLKNTALFTSKHSASFFGAFIENGGITESQKKAAQFQKSLNLNIGQVVTEEEKSFKNGKDLRKSRNKNLKEVFKTQDVTVKLVPELPQRKKTKDEIGAVINCLNLCNESKAREELSEEERLGLINWEKFDFIAMDIIKDYHNENVRNKLKNWMMFHRRKNDIKFDGQNWSWS